MLNGKNEFDKNSKMIKIKYLTELFQDVTSVLDQVSENTEVYNACGWYGKRFRNKVVKQVYKDFCAGISILNKDVCVELPHLKQKIKAVKNTKDTSKVE